MKKSQFSGGLQ